VSVLRLGRGREGEVFYLKTLSVVKICTVYSKVKVMFALEQATKAQIGSRGIALLFL
jgi:hypothetical protein